MGNKLIHCLCLLTINFSISFIFSNNCRSAVLFLQKELWLMNLEYSWWKTKCNEYICLLLSFWITKLCMGDHQHFLLQCCFCFSHDAVSKRKCTSSTWKRRYFLKLLFTLSNTCLIPVKTRRPNRPSNELFSECSPKGITREKLKNVKYLAVFTPLLRLFLFSFTFKITQDYQGLFEFFLHSRCSLVG